MNRVLIVYYKDSQHGNDEFVMPVAVLDIVNCNF